MLLQPKIGDVVMKFSIDKAAKCMGVLAVLSMIVQGEFALAAGQAVDDTVISLVAINGGGDTYNPGTSCIKTQVVAPACADGWVALPNNNKQLIAAALQAKATGSKVWLYYEAASATQHCPGLVFTPCTANSIMVK
jgi:hypothetical protein